MDRFSDEWTVPTDPDPQTILREAAENTRAGQYELALAKHIWFHENASVVLSCDTQRIEVA
jgi:hypothetical protein